MSTFKSAEVLAVDATGNVTSTMRPPVRFGVSPTTGQLRTMSPAVAWRMVSVGDSGALLLHQRGVDDPIVPAPGGYAAGKGCNGIVETTATVVAPGETLDRAPRRSPWSRSPSTSPCRPTAAR